MSWPESTSPLLLHRAVDTQAILQLERAGLQALDAWQALRWRELQGWLGAHTPWWAERLAGHTDWHAPERWPVLDRATLQAMVEARGAAPVPPHHGPLREGHTSGSTGRPVKYFASRFTQRLIDHNYYADHARQGRNPYALAAVMDVRVPVHEGDCGTDAPDIDRGMGTLLKRRVDKFSVPAHLHWLAERRPRYLTTTPTWTRALVEAVEEGSAPPVRLEQILTYAQTIEPGIRERARATLGASIRDRYSCDECGPLAFQCPHSDDHYHVAMTNVRLEVVDSEGRASPPGTVGRVLVTALHQYATPIVRYDIGDVAALHPGGCPGCGTGIAAISQLLGRRRFLIRLPDGSLIVPRAQAKAWLACAPVIQHRLVQTSATELRAEVVMARPIRPEEVEAILRMVADNASPQLHCTVVQVDEIERTASNKPQDVISLIP